MARYRNVRGTPGSPSFGTPTSSTPVPSVPSVAVERSEVKGSGTARPISPPTRQITQEQIAQRAYEIYAGRGYAPGDPTADWLEAERQLKAGL